MPKQPDNYERRIFAATLRKAPDGSRKIEGMAAVFNQLSLDLGGFREKIAPGAFTKTLQESDVRAFWNHNTDYILGRRKANTLVVSENDNGVAFSIDPPDTTYARDLIVSLDRGDVDETSFGFRTTRDSWEYSSDTDEVIRTLLEVCLVEISPCSIAAYPQTTVSARALEAAIETRNISTNAPAAPAAPASDPGIATQLLAARRRRLDAARRGGRLAIAKQF